MVLRATILQNKLGLLRRDYREDQVCDLRGHGKGDFDVELLNGPEKIWRQNRRLRYVGTTRRPQQYALGPERLLDVRIRSCCRRPPATARKPHAGLDSAVQVTNHLKNRVREGFYKLAFLQKLLTTWCLSCDSPVASLLITERSMKLLRGKLAIDMARDMAAKELQNTNEC